MEMKHGGQVTGDSYLDRQYGTATQTTKYPRQSLQDPDPSGVRSEQLLDQYLTNQKKQELFNNIQDISKIQARGEHQQEPAFSKTQNVEKGFRRDSIVNQNITVQNITIQQVTMVSSQRQSEANVEQNYGPTSAEGPANLTSEVSSDRRS